MILAPRTPRDALATVQVQDAFIPVANLGFWATPLKGLRLGASWQQPLTEKCTGTGASKICGNVIAEGVVDAELGPGLAQAASIIQNDGGALVMRFPDMIRLGATQQLGDRVNVSLEGFYEAWGEIGNLTFVPNNVVFDAGVEQISLENIVFPRRWDNTYGVRFGTRAGICRRRGHRFRSKCVWARNGNPPRRRWSSSTRAGSIGRSWGSPSASELSHEGLARGRLLSSHPDG